MSSKITFLNDHWFWSIVVAAIILLGVFIWKEFAVQGRRRVMLKIALSIFAIGTLALIALQPALPSLETTGKIVLLTPGYETLQLDSLRKEHRRLKVLDYSPQQGISDDIQNAEVVYILGSGLRDYDLPKMEKIPSFYFPGRPPEGIVKIKYPDKIIVGEYLNIHGLYRKARSGNWLILEGPGGTGLDSLELNNENEEQQFLLTTELKAAGNFVYYLAEKDPDGEVITRDPIPIQVEEQEGLRILILNNFPTFETKYLKNFLAEAGHELVVRSQITRGRFKYEYFNTSRTVIGSLSIETLQPYDLLIIDAASLRSLAASQFRAIENSVRDDGLGVYIQADEAFFNSSGRLSNLKFKRQSSSDLRLENWPDVIIAKFPFVHNSSPGLENIYSAGNSVMAGYNRIGQGRVGTTVLSNTWHLVLEGNSETYRQIWSGIIGQLSKRENVTAQFHPEAKFVFPNEPYHFKIMSAIVNPIITNNEGRILPLAQDVNFPEQWRGTLWPREQGWNSLHQDTTTVFNYYVAEEGSWGSLVAQKTFEKNRVYFDRSLETVRGKMPAEPIKPLWFYGLFLISIGGLWLEPKLTGF
ncbi:MAG TPA: hypothetical protein VLN46_04575 [Gillisia sp.]|nr:hypothetical protein [Gillisia sp.]